MTERLLVRGLAKGFVDGRARREVLSTVDLEVAPGEMVAVMGPSGSGKSTLLHLVAGLDRPDAGRIQVDGVHLGALDAKGLAELRRQKVGYVEQRLNLIAALTAIENVMLPLELDGRGTRAARLEAMEALDSVDVAELATTPADRLSGGEQQRVAIARALVGGRGLLLADEPTAALDSMNGENVMRLLRRRCDDDGVAVLLSTHDASHAAWADRVLFLRDGSIIDEAVPAHDQVSEAADAWADDPDATDEEGAYR